jgi:hypothetical protein
VQLGIILETQLRPLVKLEPEQQRKVWKKAVKMFPEGKMTAAHVAKVVEEMMETATYLSRVPPLVFTQGRFRGMGLRGWICVICRTRQDEESSGPHCPEGFYQ